MRHCRFCGSPISKAILDLGDAPLTNTYLTQEDLATSEARFPLQLLVCEHCWLVQTLSDIDRENIFTKSYPYFSSASTSWLAHARKFVDEISLQLKLDENSLVIEIGANDGYLLQFFKEKGIPSIGIEPTESTATAARERGIEIVQQFFCASIAHEIKAAKKEANLLIANNVLAHVPDINDFVSGCAEVIANDGIAVFEFPHLVELVRNNQFDTVYHEHFSYFSLSTVCIIFEKNGLRVIDAVPISTHGGSLRVYATRVDNPLQCKPGAKKILEIETQLGIASLRFYKTLQSSSNFIRDEFAGFLRDLRTRKVSVGAYGAAAKGATLLNYAKIGSHLLPYVADRNPFKQGKYLPGSHIPIVDEKFLKDRRPEYIVILPWNIYDEIISQLEYAREWGAQFVRAIPRLEIR